MGKKEPTFNIRSGEAYMNFLSDWWTLGIIKGTISSKLNLAYSASEVAILIISFTSSCLHFDNNINKNQEMDFASVYKTEKPISYP